MTLRPSPSNPNHGEKLMSCRSAGPPRVQLKSQYVVPIWLTVPPACTHQLFRSCVCVFVLNARSVGRPLVVQNCHQLKLAVAWRCQRDGLLVRSCVQVAHVTWSERCMKPMSFTSKPAE